MSSSRSPQSRRVRRAGLLTAVGLALTATLLAPGLAGAEPLPSDPLPPVPTEPGPICVGQEILEISPGLSALVPSTGRVDNAGVLGTETCAGDALGYRATGPIRIEHHIEYGAQRPSTCADVTMTGYALHHIPTAEGEVTVRNDFRAILGTFHGTKFSGTYGFVPLEGDCVTTPLTKFKVVFTGYWNDNSRE